MSPRYRAPVSEPPPDPAALVRLVESSDSDPVKCVQYGCVKPLIDCLRGGSPTAECKAAADLLEKMAADIELGAWETKETEAALDELCCRSPKRSWTLISP